MVTRILDTMIATSGQFAAEHWQYAALAAAASGVIGSGSGASGAGYVGQMVPILEALLDVEFAAGNAYDVFVIALTAQTLGAEGLRAEATAKYAELQA